MCERTDSKAAQDRAAQQLLSACTSRCPDLIKDASTVKLLPDTPDADTFDALLNQIDQADSGGKRKHGRH